MPFDTHIEKKEEEKCTNYCDLMYETKRIWKIKIVEVIPVVIGVLGGQYTQRKTSQCRVRNELQTQTEYGLESGKFILFVLILHFAFITKLHLHLQHLAIHSLYV